MFLHRIGYLPCVQCTIGCTIQPRKREPHPVRLIKQEITNKGVVDCGVQQQSVSPIIITKTLHHQNGDKSPQKQRPTPVAILAAASPKIVKTSSIIVSTTSPKTIPDIRGWNVERVYNYFKFRFPDCAAVFRNEEIDGTAILEMERQDLVGGRMKLGPALNCWCLIRQMQGKVRRLS